MDRKSLCLKTSLLAGALVAAPVSGALALEADDVAERLKSLLADQQVALTYEGARMEGDDVVLEGVKATSAMDDDDTLSLGDLTLQDVSEEDDGTFRIGTFAVDAFEHEEDDIRVSMEGLTVDGLVLPADAEDDPFAGAMRYDRMAVARVDVEGENGPLGSLENVYADITVEDDDTMRGEGGAESFSLNLSAIGDDDASTDTLQELGYSQISGSLYTEGSWSPDDGRVTLSRYETTIEDAGTLFLMLDFSGYTPEFISTLQEMSEDSGSDDASAKGMAMMGLMQQLSFHGLTLRFEDDSLTGKLLQYTADKQGAKASDVVGMARMVIPMQLTPFLGEELTERVAEAVGTFLENPQNIEIRAEPENPVPFAMLMGAAMGAPQELVKQTGLTIEANQ